MSARVGFSLPLVWIGVVCLAILQMHTGIADNGDFERSAGWLLEKPTGFASNIPPFDTPEREARFFTRWHPEWEYREAIEFAPHLVSSYQVLLLVGWLANHVAGMPVYSLVVASWISRVLLLASILYLAKNLFGRVWGLWAAALAFICLDSRYIAYLNSFYQEHAAILFFLLLVAALARLATEAEPRALLLCCVALFLFSTVKVQYLLTPLVLLVAWMAGQRWFGRPSRRIVLALATVQVLVMPLLLDNKYAAHNHYNALFNGALFFDRRDFPDWLSPQLQECVGVQVWSRNPDCFARLDGPVGLREIGAAYAQNPVSLLKGIDYGIRHLNGIDFADYSLATDAVPSFHAAGPVNLWNRLKRLGAGFPVYLELGVVLAALVFGRKAVPHLSQVGFFLLAFVLSQVGISLLGEGSVDLEKHLLLANLALDLTAVIAAFLLFRLLRRDVAEHPFPSEVKNR